MLFLFVTRNWCTEVVSLLSQKTCGFSGLPQSTLSPVSGNGSPTGHSKGPSPSTTPFIGNDDAWDLICAAAGQMNGLKMKNEGAIKNRGLLAPTRNFTQIHPPNPTNGFYNTHVSIFIMHNNNLSSPSQI